MYKLFAMKTCANQTTLVKNGRSFFFKKKDKKVIKKQKKRPKVISSKEPISYPVEPHRDNSWPIRAARNVFAGRNLMKALRFVEQLSCRSQPPPDLPRPPNDKLAKNAYCLRAPLAEVARPEALRLPREPGKGCARTPGETYHNQTPICPYYLNPRVHLHSQHLNMNTFVHTRMGPYVNNC